MKPTLFMAVMSKTGAIILIIVLLLVAGVIGYLTAWFYAKSVYTPIIKGLEDDKAQLNREISRLKDEIAKLKNDIDNLKEKAGELEKELTEKDKLIEDLRKKLKE